MSKFTPLTAIGRRIIELRATINKLKDDWTKSREIILKFFKDTTIDENELKKKSNKELLEILWKDFEDSSTVEITETSPKIATLIEENIIL